MIRIAEARDARNVAEIYRPYVEETAITFEEEAPSTAEMESRMAKVGAMYPWLVAEETDADGVHSKVLGYAYASKYRERAAYRWSLESSIYVERESRGRGLGGALYGALIPILREMGIEGLYGVVTLPNPASLALHARFGFEPLCTFAKVGYKRGAWHDVGWTVLRLRGPDADGAARPADPIPFPELARSRPERIAELLRG
jgi:L-amino acid N-acyltransferase YncA